MPKVHQVALAVWRQIIIILVMIVLAGLSLLLLSLLIPLLIIKLLVGMIARKIRPDLAGFVYGKRVSMAVKFIHMKPKFVVLLHIVFDGSLPAEKIRIAYLKNIHTDLNYSHLKQTWTQFLGFLFWTWEKDFDLNHHIRYYDFQDKNLVMPDICTEADLQRVTPHLISKPFKEGTSPWEALVIPNYRAASNATDKTQSVVVFRVHHLLADGYSLLKLFVKVFGLDESIVPQPNFPKYSLLSRIWRGLVLPITLLYHIASQIVDGMNWGTSWHVLGKKLSGKYNVFLSDQVLVDRIKQIKNKYCVSYNLAAYAIAIGGFRRLMIEARQEIPRNISCFVPLPIPNHPGGLDLHVSGFVFSFSARVESPIKRIRQLSNIAQIVSHDPAVHIALSCCSDLIALLPISMVKLLRNKLPIMMGMTSFPGPDTELDVMGTVKCVDAIPAVCGPAGQFGACCALISVAGKQRFVWTVDQVIFDACRTPVNFARHIENEIFDLLHADCPTLQSPA